MRHPEADVAIIGLGWAGATIASELTAAGLRVVGLERGPWPADPDVLHLHDDLQDWARWRQMQRTSRESWTLRHDLREPALPLRHLGSFLPGEGVGGTGLLWNGMAVRFLPHDFIARSSSLARYGEDALPPDSTVQDWGVTYDELEPDYDRFEYAIGVSGRAGNLGGRHLEGGNPFEGRRRRPFPVEPVRKSEETELFRDAAEAAGFHPYPIPAANLPHAYAAPEGGRREVCRECAWSMATPLNTMLPRAQATGNLEVRACANVYRIGHDGRRAHEVLYRDGDGEHSQLASVVVLAAYTLSNTRLLLLSGMGRPYDVATGRGVVGRNYAYQVTYGATGFFRNRRFHRITGSDGDGYAIDDLNSDNFDHTGLGFLGGGMVASLGSAMGPLRRMLVPPGTPDWGPEWKRAMRDYYDGIVPVRAQGEVLSMRWRFMDLDPTYRDAWGEPLLRITFDWSENERRMARYQTPRIADILRAAGADSIAADPELPAHYDTVRYQSTHNTGGAAMGTDPAVSVVGPDLRMWDLENVWVVGASAFPQNPGANPTATVGALAYRAAESILGSCAHLRKDETSTGPQPERP